MTWGPILVKRLLLLNQHLTFLIRFFDLQPHVIQSYNVWSHPLCTGSQMHCAQIQPLSYGWWRDSKCVIAKVTVTAATAETSSSSSCCHSRQSCILLTFSSGRFCNSSLPPLVLISTRGDTSPLRLSAPRGISRSLAGLRACGPVSRLTVLGVREPLWPTLSASKSMVLLSNAPSTLQNKPPCFCRATGSAVPGRARYTGRSSSALSPFPRRSAMLERCESPREKVKAGL